MRSVGVAIALVCWAQVADSAPTTHPATRPASVQRARPASKRPIGKLRRARVRSRFATPDEIARSAAYRYGSLSSAACEAELDARKVPYTREHTAGARGITTPVRLTGPLHGVEFRTNLPAAQRATTPWELADCRLVLALDDFAEILAAHDIVEVRHYSMHRLVPKGWPEGKPTKQHMAGNAIDAARFIARDGSYLDVDQHWHGAIGDATCGDKAAPHPATREALALRSILCEAVSRRLFNVVLTPNFNRPHKNHFHLEVTDPVRWFLVH